MAYTTDDYYPPLDGHPDTRRLALFADNCGLQWSCVIEPHEGRRRATVVVGGEIFQAEGANDQAALDSATGLAIAGDHANQGKLFSIE